MRRFFVALWKLIEVGLKDGGSYKGGKARRGVEDICLTQVHYAVLEPPQPTDIPRQIPYNLIEMSC